jgi:signal transduction histidine kinase
MRIASADDGEIKVRMDNSWREFLVGWGIGLLTASVATYLHNMFAAVAPAAFVWSWSAVNGVVVLLQLTNPTAALLRRPSHEELMRIWSPLSKVSGYLFGLNLAISIWLLLPYAGPELRFFMVAVYLAAASWQVVTAAEGLGFLIWYIVTILGSASLFFLRAEGPYATAMGVFLGVFGALLILAAATLRQTVRGALAARLEAERSAQALEVALADAKSAREERERFMAAASHDLRQPIHAATLFFHKLTRTKDPAVRAEAEAGVKLAFEEADALLERMLDHLRLEASAMEPKIEPLSIAGVFGRAVSESTALADAGAVALKASPTRLWVSGDRSMIAGVLRNFLHNAIRHADAGQIRLAARVRGKKVRLYAIDDGRGVAADERDGLFQPYVQGKRSGQMARSGLGLGLASAKRMAELMGGDVGLDGSWRRGAAFYLELPRAEPRVAPKARPVEAVARASGRRVLILDDDDAARHAMAGIFATEGWGVMTAADPAEARRLAEAQACDLMISDWRLADGQTGADAVEVVRAARPDLPVLLVTGDGSWQTHKAIAMSGLPVLFKPTAPARILALADHLSATH